MELGIPEGIVGLLGAGFGTGGGAGRFCTGGNAVLETEVEGAEVLEAVVVEQPGPRTREVGVVTEGSSLRWFGEPVLKNEIQGVCVLRRGLARGSLRKKESGD